MKIKITTGYTQDEKFTVDIQEAHKAYYLFNNPDKRGTFENGMAIRGSDIHSIAPDWNATMGWNATHKIDDDDWNEINAKGMNMKMQELLGEAKKVAYLGKDKPELMAKKLDDVKQLLLASSAH